jgi:hypothetical protein
MTRDAQAERPLVPEWEQKLASRGGHPLQSATWGLLREQLMRTPSLFLEGETWMARVERRHLPVVGRMTGDVAWIPRGPAGPSCSAHILDEMAAQLRAQGFCAFITSGYPNPGTRIDDGATSLVLNLTCGDSALLNDKLRYASRRAARDGASIREEPWAVAEFYAQCMNVARTKAFELPGSLAIMEGLLDATPTTVHSHLFVTRLGDDFMAGALIVCCGSSMHYFWGAGDRAFSRHLPMEALQAYIIEWGADRGLTAYDLEGIDHVRNPGVARFKQKLGGDSVSLPPTAAQSLNWRGKAAVTAIRLVWSRQ